MATVNESNPRNFEYQDYNSKDDQLIASFNIDTTLTSSSCIEFFIFDLNGNVLNSRYDYQNYQVLNTSPNGGEGLSQIILNPGNDTNSYGFSTGQYTAYYNFLVKRVGDYNNYLYVKEISSDRTEIRLDSSILTDIELINQTEDFIDDREDSPYFLDFFLDFGDNQLIISNNIKIVDENTPDPSILVKLYEPLPVDFLIKDQVWVVTEFAEPKVYNINNTPKFAPSLPSIPSMQGPNFAIPIKNEVNNSSQNLSYNDIISSAPTSSQNQIKSLLEETSINISVDYNNFLDFIHFSSVQTRIENFYYKTSLIETYNNQFNALTNVTSSSTSQLIIEQKVLNIIKNFDQFEYFMYYSSGSINSYPKSTTTPPYTLMPTGSAEVLTWLGSTDENSGNYGGLLLSASNFDNENPDQLLKTIPEYLREDPENKPYDLFVDMVAQYYDNIWLYTKDITQKYNADNRLDFGISKDLVSDAIKDFGLKLYQNNFSNQELYTAFLGLTPGGSTFPFPEITGSLPAPTGFEFVDTLISASNDVISMDDTNKSLYKRIYHNIPYLLKSKGTLTGLRALITSYGIPDTILKISEFGGKDQVNANDYDLYFNNFNYAFNTTNNFISSSWVVNSDWNAPNNRPSTVQFRFKSEEFPPTNLSQTLWFVDDSADPAILVLDYSGSGLISGSYDGSIKDPNYQVANLKLIPYSDNTNESASISLPFYNGNWWSVMVTTDQNGTYNLYAGNKIYNGNDGTSIGYYASASVTGANDGYWKDSTRSIFAEQNTSPDFSSYKAFSGSLQEIRYYNTQISESVFKDYVMNPLSFEGNGINSAPNQLIFRAALGSELDITTSSSIHPQVTGSWTTTSSFASDSNFYFSGSAQYYKNTETLFLDQPAVGIKNRITDKIRSENDTIPSGSVLSPIRPLSQIVEASASYTPNINYLEVAFSPQNQINDDIIGQMGHFNIGDYIGDPSQRFSGNNYPDLNNLSEDYFKKYIKQYDLVDFVRLIKFFDNSLFKMIKDFIPVRTSLSSGLVIKQHLLERNKYPQPQVLTSDESELSGSVQVESFSGGAAGMFNPFNISYDLEFFSSSLTTNFTVSASSGAGLSLSNGETFISGSDGPPITNASSLPYFTAFTPNLYVQINSSGGTLEPFSFNSGSEPGLTSVVSASFDALSLFNINQINVTNITSNSTENLAFTGFDNGFIVSTPAIFNNPTGNVLTNSSSISSIDNVSVFSTFPTRSIFTNVSGSGRLGTPIDNNTTNLLTQDTNVDGSVFANFSDFSVSSFISASSDIFLNPSGSLLIASGSGVATHNSSTTQFIFSATTLNTNSPTANPLTLFDNAFVQVTSTDTLSPVNLFNDGTVSGTSISQIHSILSSTQFRTTYTLNTNLSEPPTNVNFTFISGSAGGTALFNIYSEGNSDKSMITDIQSTNLSTEFVTSSILTDVSASGTITFNQEIGGALRFTIGTNTSNVDGGDMANFQEFKDGGYITTTNPIFSGSGVDSQIASSSVDVLGSGNTGFRINGELSPVITPVSGSGNLSFFIGTSTATTMSVANPNITNVSSNKLPNFQEFANGGYITTTNPIFSGSGVNNQVNSASISSIVDQFGFSFLNINAVTSSILTDVSMSGNFDFNSSIPANRLLLNSSQFNASTQGFFDNTAAYISASDDGSQGVDEYVFPFIDNFGGVTNIAPISSTSNVTYLVIDTTGGYSKNSSANNLTFNFKIISDNTNPSSTSFISASSRPTISGESFVLRTGSISQGTAGSTTFNSSSIRTSVTNEPFTFRTGSISQGIAGSTTFVSSSARNSNGTTFSIHTGSYDNIQTFTNLGTTYISESARNIVGTSFVIHSGSLNNDLGISFTSESIKPQSHSRAQVASIGADNVIDFASDWSINSDGEVAGEEFQLFDSLIGGSNTFISSSTAFTYIYEQLNQIPPSIFNITQSYSVTTPSLVGNITTLHNSQDEFYNGELSGSVLLVSNGELNEGCEPFKEINPFLADYKVRVYPDTTTGFTEGKFLQNNNLPLDGYIQVFYGDEPGSPLAPVLPNTSAG